MIELLRFLVEDVGITGVLLVLGCLLLIAQKRPLGRATGLLLLFFATPLTGNEALRLMDRGVALESVLSSDVEFEGIERVVMLGAGSFYDSAGDAWPTRGSVWRASAASALAKHYDVPLILSGGVVNQQQPNEAETIVQKMQPQLVGINVVLETLSKNTAENAREVAKIAELNSVSRVLVVTSASHSLRSLLAFQDYPGLQVDFVTVHRAGDLTLKHLVPREQGLWIWRVLFRELFGIAWYRWQGWI